MNYVSLATFSFLLLIDLSTFSFEHSIEQYLTTFITQFKRPLTMWELSRNNFEMALLTEQTKIDATCVELQLEPTDVLPQTARDNVIVLAPKQLTIHDLKILSHCEQPDMIIVHELPDYNERVLDDYITQCLKIGDYCGIDFPDSNNAIIKRYLADQRLMRIIHHDNDNGVFLFLKTPKEGLTKARWTSKLKQKNRGKIPYPVNSDFDQKTISKEVNGKRITSEWKSGINLVTFVMLRGIYPSNDVIIKQIKTLCGIKHNDLVMGNLLIQGHKLIPIDFDDKRRNISSTVCIDALLKIFEQHPDLRMQDPKKFIDLYKKIVKNARK